jgi:hypothetical protein
VVGDRYVLVEIGLDFERRHARPPMRRRSRPA